MMTVMRTIIELPREQLDALDAWCGREHISRAEAVRRAVAAHLKQIRTSGPVSAFGLWRRRHVDGLNYERRLRREWDGEPLPPPQRKRRTSRSR
jgi:hypothetical protein